MGPPQEGGETAMNAVNRLATLGAVSILVLSLAPASKAARADSCQLRMGPYTSQSEAEAGVKQAAGVGFRTSSVFGESNRPSPVSNQRYFFDVLFTC
jgi:hypothetical protein